jgi:hypothetical protein
MRLRREADNAFWLFMLISPEIISVHALYKLRLSGSIGLRSATWIGVLDIFEAMNLLNHFQTFARSNSGD